MILQLFSIYHSFNKNNVFIKKNLFKIINNKIMSFLSKILTG